jgi:hypothetical protein
MGTLKSLLSGRVRVETAIPRELIMLIIVFQVLIDCYQDEE